jgi:hypothetical protein
MAGRTSAERDVIGKVADWSTEMIVISGFGDVTG